MKKMSLVLIGVMCLLFTACDKESTRHDSLSLANIMIVKFHSPEQRNKVIVQHPFKRYDGVEGRFDYYDNIGLYLNVVPEQCASEDGYGMDLSLVEWIAGEMHIAGSSPYIRLADDYYMIDWKWHQLLPLSTLSNVWENAYHNPLEEHLSEHCFITDMEWTDLKDLSAGYENSQYTQHITDIETVKIKFRTIDQLYDDVKQDDPYVCWNMSLYSDGLSVANAYMYYKYGTCDKESGKTYRTYIDYCDSLQSIYQKRLVEIINKGQLKKILQ